MAIAKSAWILSITGPRTTRRRAWFPRHFPEKVKSSGTSPSAFRALARLQVDRRPQRQLRPLEPVAANPQWIHQSQPLVYRFVWPTAHGKCFSSTRITLSATFVHMLQAWLLGRRLSSSSPQRRRLPPMTAPALRMPVSSMPRLCKCCAKIWILICIFSLLSHFRLRNLCPFCRVSFDPITTTRYCCSLISTSQESIWLVMREGKQSDKRAASLHRLLALLRKDAGRTAPLWVGRDSGCITTDASAIVARCEKFLDGKAYGAVLVDSLDVAQDDGLDAAREWFLRPLFFGIAKQRAHKIVFLAAKTIVAIVAKLDVLSRKRCACGGWRFAVALSGGLGSLCSCGLEQVCWQAATLCLPRLLALASSLLAALAACLLLSIGRGNSSALLCICNLLETTAFAEADFDGLGVAFFLLVVLVVVLSARVVAAIFAVAAAAVVAAHDALLAG
eukprot:m.44424 g.44424  ORF g.44424 m.44424 type:complete len:447 (-) comp6193_c0_seq3:203-1543(-)